MSAMGSDHENKPPRSCGPDALACSLLVVPGNPHPKRDWHVVIEVEHQSFALAYKGEDRKDAEWMASMLRFALEKCGARISPASAEEPRQEGLDETTCPQCAEWRKLADDALDTLRTTREKYGIGDRHVMREKNREIEKLRKALQDATELLGEIMRDEVNHQDEAEKWLRAYREICPKSE